MERHTDMTSPACLVYAFCVNNEERNAFLKPRVRRGSSLSEQLSPLKDVVPLKIHRPRPGLNPRILGPVASTITTRLPRATI
jgi:hypothetical protein